MRGKTSAGRSSAERPAKKKRANSRASGIFSLLGAFVATSVALGLLLAGVMLPLTGLTGAGVKNGVHLFNTMPNSLSANALSQQSKILAKDGSVIATPSDDSRIVVPSSAIPKVMKNAQVAIEDERFYQHGALDQRGIARAIAANLFSSGSQGASTLTQQYVKIADQTQALASGNKEEALKAVAHSGTEAYVRKLKQLKFAVELEKTHTKDQILTSYLNLVYFGDLQYGIEAASKHYFGHPAKDLTLPEAATLAGVVNLPDATNPVKNPKAAVKRRNIVIEKMVKQGMVSKADGDAAINSPLKLHLTAVSGGCQTSKYPYFCDYVTNWLAQQPALGKTPKERLGKLNTAGLVIQTALDPKQTKALDDAIRKKVPAGNSADVQSAGVTIEPGTGLITAMAQNAKFDVAGTDFFHTSLNYTNRGFSVGSTAKLFAIVEAVKQGKNADSTVDIPRMTGNDPDGPYAPFTSKNFGGECGQKRGVWNVHNDDQEPSGPMDYREMTAKSVNTGFAALTASLGPCKVHQDFADFGVFQKLDSGAEVPIVKDPSNIVLGTGSSSAIMMANAYAVIAGDGKYCPPRPVESIKQANGKPLQLQIPGCKQLLTPDQARNVAKVFRGPLDKDGTAAASKLGDDRDALGKTGTDSAGTQTWFVGSTRQLSTAVWVGHAADNPARLRDITLAGQHYSGTVFASDIAAPVWKLAMDEMSKGMPKERFPDPKGGKTQAAVPDVSGKSEAEARDILTKLKLKVSVKHEDGGSGKSGQVTRTDPKLNSNVDENSDITIYVKN